MAIISSSFLVTIISSSFFLAFFDMSWNNFVGETKIDDGKENGRGALLYHFPPLSASIFAGAKKMVSNHGSPPKCPHWSLLFYFSLHSSFFLHFLPFSSPSVSFCFSASQVKFLFQVLPTSSREALENVTFSTGYHLKSR